MKNFDSLVGKKILLLVAMGSIPVGTEGVVTAHLSSVESGDRVSVRICGLDLNTDLSNVEVVESDGIAAGKSVGARGEALVGADTSIGSGDVSGTCEKCGGLFAKADSPG